MKPLHILLLGPPEVRWGGELITIQRRIPRALLFFLASRGGMVGRNELLTLFWEDHPDHAARARLRETIHRLRNSFPDPEIILVQEDLVGLDFDRVYVDLLELDRLVEAAGRISWWTASHTPLNEASLNAMQKALRLWRGPRFMSGAKLPATQETEDWLSRLTQHTDLIYLSLLERMAKHAHATGDLVQASQFTRLWIANDGLNEDAQAYLIELLAEMGRVDEARRQFDQASRLLEKEMNTSPGLRLRSAYEKIGGETLKPSPLVEPAWNVRDSLAAPFVGRQAVLAQLNRRWPRGGIVFLLGESGQGKTRLLQEFATQLYPRPRVVVARCRPSEDHLPFQPVIDVARDYLHTDTLRKLHPQWANILLPMLPELGNLRIDLKPLAGILPQPARSLALEAVRQTAALFCRNENILGILDDAQWADPATLEVAAYLSERPPFDRRQLIILAARSEEISPQLEALMLAAQKGGRATIIHLPRLSLVEVSQLVRNVLGETRSPQFIERLTGDTGGNPLFILETLRALQEQYPQSDVSQTVQFPLAESVETLIRGRLQTLSPVTREILEIAAIIGAVFDPALIENISQRMPEECIGALNELEEKSLVELVNSQTGRGSYRFIHDKIREVLLQFINPLQARLLHEKVARVLAARLGSQTHPQAAILAQHFENANLWNEAFDYWLQAGAYARQLFSTQEAIHAYERAERLVSVIGHHLADKHLYRLYSAWSKILFEIDDPVALKRLGDTLLDLGKDRASPQLIGTALIRLSDEAFARGQFADALEYADEAIPYLSRSDNLYEYMEAHNRQGSYRYMLNHWDKALESFQNALAIGGDSQSPDLLMARASADYHLALAHNLRGWPGLACHHAERMLSAYITLEDVHGQLAAYGILSLVRYFMGDYLQARADNQIGIEMAERIQAWRMLGYLNDYRGMIELALGNVDACLKHARQAIQVGERHSHNEIASVGYRLMGDVYLWLKLPEKSVEYYQRAFQVSGEGFLGVDHIFRLGLVLCLTGQREAGQSYLDKAAEICDQAGLGLVSGLERLAQARVHLVGREYQLAHQLITQTIEDANQRVIPPFRLLATNLLAATALASEEFELPIEELQATADEAAQMRYTWMELDARVLLNKIEQRLGIINPATRQRMIQLLDQLEKHITCQPFNEFFKAYRQQLTQ